MKLWITCAVAVLLWAGADALAQGKGKDKTEQPRVQENAKSNVPQPDAGTVEQAGKDAAKGGKRAKDMTASESKQGGPKGKKLEQPTDVAGKGKGKGGQQQLQAMQKQAQHELAKHMERQARLTRIRELAVQKGDTATVERVDKLIQKELQVYDRKLQHVQGQKKAMQQPGATGNVPATPPAEPNATKKPEAAPSTSAPAGASGGNTASPPANPPSTPNPPSNTKQ